MSAGHTPGPWVAAPYEGFGPRTTVRQGCERTGMRIASTFETTSPRNVERNEANARLIAAAPDLLEAVRAYVQHFEAHHITNTHGGRDFDFTGHIAQLARAAISKATGEQA